MPSRTQIVCLHEGKKGRSIDPVFINTLLRCLDPSWLRPWKGSNTVRLVACGGRTELINRTPRELRSCLAMGGDTTLMVWADLDHDMSDGDELTASFWNHARSSKITRDQFDQILFIFAKDRLENWIEFLLTGTTDESREGPRQPEGRLAAQAARRLAEKCRKGLIDPPNPPSLDWSCANWHALADRMRR